MRVLFATLLAGLVAAASQPAQEVEKAKVAAAKIQVATLDKAVAVYKLKHDDYPDKLDALVEKKLVEARALTDPWGKSYQYDPAGKKNDGKKPDLWTVAPDKTLVGNWPEKK